MQAVSHLKISHASMVVAAVSSPPAPLFHLPPAESKADYPLMHSLTELIASEMRYALTACISNSRVQNTKI